MYLRLLTHIERDRQKRSEVNQAPRSPEAIGLARIHKQGLIFAYYAQPNAQNAWLVTRRLYTDVIYDAMADEAFDYVDKPAFVDGADPEPEPTPSRWTRLKAAWLSRSGTRATDRVR